MYICIYVYTYLPTIRYCVLYGTAGACVSACVCVRVSVRACVRVRLWVVRVDLLKYVCIYIQKERNMYIYMIIQIVCCMVVFVVHMHSCLPILGLPILPVSENVYHRNCILPEVDFLKNYPMSSFNVCLWECALQIHDADRPSNILCPICLLHACTLARLHAFMLA